MYNTSINNRLNGERIKFAKPCMDDAIQDVLDYCEQHDLRIVSSRKDAPYSNPPSHCYIAGVCDLGYTMPDGSYYHCTTSILYARGGTT